MTGVDLSLAFSNIRIELARMDILELLMRGGEFPRSLPEGDNRLINWRRCDNCCLDCELQDAKKKISISKDKK